MEYNLPSEIVKDLSFGANARDEIMQGVTCLTNAVKSTLGASGRCVIYEDARGKPVITKDGVTVAESVVLHQPVKNLGATLIKEAARNTVNEAGDGTTTATILAHAILKESYEHIDKNNIRQIKEGLQSGLSKILRYLDDATIEVNDSTLESVANISCNNDKETGAIISSAFKKVGKDGVVLIEDSDTFETTLDIVEGTQLECGLSSPYLATDKDKGISELDNPYVLIVSSPITSIRKIQSVLEHVIKCGRSLLIIANVEQQPKAALVANRVKGNIKVNIIDPPGFGPTKEDTIEDLAFLTGATVINEALGDDLDLIDPSCLGEAIKSVTDAKYTVLQTKDLGVDFAERVENVQKKIKKEQNKFLKQKLEQRLAMLSGSVGVIKVGANSKVELKEKRDRVDDSVHATKAALKEGIVPGGGIALLNASQKINSDNIGEEIILKAIQEPCKVILDNAGLPTTQANAKEGTGVNVITGKYVNMIKEGIIDPVLVTKTALKNAVSVATTVLSADCVISNMRINESS